MLASASRGVKRPIAAILNATRRIQPYTRHVSTTAGGIADPIAYCRDLVRKHDYESFLISHLWPREVQPGYFALKAFYVELATIQETVSNAMIGKMRMQFWRDVVKDITEGKPPQHPIALALARASKAAHLAPYHLRRIIDARDAELSGASAGHMTVESLTQHGEATASTLNYLLLALLRLGGSETLAHAASHLGVAQTIGILLRALPYHASRGRMVIPAEITARHGVRQEEVFRRGGATEGLADAVFELATVGNDHLMTAREMLKELEGKVPRGAMGVFAAGVPVGSYLQRLEAANFDAYAAAVQGREWQLAWRVWISYHRCKF
ncbi:isoprenoid synthase domain-containing protein [Vararia minispora EC-137]|uniref:Isoprenoid synthase domain-containing protein n=1 Tax=Vararia minispora EC-137 TaxID=1314806 RepID=A0ACB8QSU3_9AGAM|nr:isoprenoid synthase domain-containing protein [Vararia minispora EC-137]